LNFIRFSQEKTLKLYSNLSKDLVGYGFFAALSKCTGLLLLPILTRLFSEDDYGIFDLILSISVFAGVFISLSLESAMVRFWSLEENRKQNAEMFMTCMFTVFFFGSLVITSSFVLAELSLFTFRYHDLILSHLPIAITAIVFQVLFNFSNVCFRMRREIVKFNLMNLAHTFSYVFLSLFFVIEQNCGITGLFYGSLLAGVFCLIISLLLNREFLGFRFSTQKLISFLKYSLPIMPGVLTTLVNARADRFIILNYIGYSMVGVYAAVFTYSSVVQVLVSIFRNAWTPHSIKVLKEKASVRDEIFSKVLNYYLIGFFSASIIFVLCSGFLVDLILPPAYQSGVVIVPWLVGAAVLHGASNFANIGTMVTKRTIGNSYAAVLALSSNVLLSLLLIEKHGLKGAAIGTFVSELLFFAFLLTLSYRQIKIRFNIKTITVVLLVYVCFCLWISFFREGFLL
jgi:O-antigen/teichoic acid export membrane protein